MILQEAKVSYKQKSEIINITIMTGLSELAEIPDILYCSKEVYSISITISKVAGLLIALYLDFGVTEQSWIQRKAVFP